MLILFLASSLLSATPARAAGPQPTASDSLAEAKILFDNDELSAAEGRLEKAMKGEGLSRAEEIELYAHLAVIRLRLGFVDAAKEAYRKLLSVDPNARISRRIASMKVMLFFTRFREKELRSSRASIKHTPPSQIAFGAPLQLSCYVVDRSGTVTRVAVYFREKGTSGEYSSTSLAVDPADPSHFQGVIPYLFPDHSEPFEVEYYLAAVTVSDAWVSTVGSLKKPLTFEVEGGRAPAPVDDGPKFYSRWWFWTGVGAVLLGGAAAGAYGYRASRPLPETGGALVVIR